MARILFIIVGFVVALICLGMVYMAFSDGYSGGTWLFAAFAFLFGAPAVVSLIHLIQRKNPEQTAPAGVRFVPHWQLMAMIGIALFAILIIIFSSIRR